ncbi:PAB-dependent poly(A)-specific ribonuclease subunit 3 [Acrasis kona]|uniref:PAB-dependent poly(A)-specific ribonuclease subunit 3 n=1 Tax=Acrasis kona TaxID=1008807 RepID=A0AAW2YJ04_9EUKA
MSNPLRQKGVNNTHSSAYYGDYSNNNPYTHQSGGEYYQQGYYPSQIPYESMYQSQYIAQNRTANDLFVNDTLRSTLMSKNDFLMSTLNSLQQQQIKRTLPKVIQEYHTLYPLDSLLKVGVSRGLNVTSESYKAVGSKGEGVVLRRILNSPNVTLDAERIKSIRSWGSIAHPNVVVLRDVITTNAFGGGQQDAVFIYELFYGCETLESLLKKYSILPEDLIWSYVVQIVSALREIHQVGAYQTGFETSRILVSPNKRLKLNCIGLVDIMGQSKPMSDEELQSLKNQDLKDFGKLLFNLVCHSNSITLDQAHNEFSSDLIGLIEYLTQGVDVNLDHVVSMISTRILNEMTAGHIYNDYLEEELTKELDNGRLFKLLSKIDYVAQHVDKLCTPVHNGSSTITKTDSQVLTLFRDYLFHQTPPDFGLIVDTLNKLEVGSTEQILLMSRDEQTLLVVEYKDIKRCIAAGFNRLINHFDA